MQPNVFLFVGNDETLRLKVRSIVLHVYFDEQIWSFTSLCSAWDTEHDVALVVRLPV